MNALRTDASRIDLSADVRERSVALLNQQLADTIRIRRGDRRLQATGGSPSSP
jgi:hypothetical protein